MKPSFALNFSDDSIGLLHRTSRGWLEVGTVPLDEPDLGQAMAYLRGSALGLEPRGITTKLVIPNSQIRYMSLAAPGPDAASRRAQIKAGLEGRTPYPVDDLVFDWWGKGQTVQVAVVARETLTEAEAFARENRLNPLSFVAIPEPGAYGAEPWFGTTAMAATLLVPGEKVDRDQDPVQIVGRLPKLDRAEAIAESDLAEAAAPAVSPDASAAAGPMQETGPAVATTGPADPVGTETAALIETVPAVASQPEPGIALEDAGDGIALPAASPAPGDVTAHSIADDVPDGPPDGPVDSPAPKPAVTAPDETWASKAASVPPRMARLTEHPSAPAAPVLPISKTPGAAPPLRPAQVSPDVMKKPAATPPRTTPKPAARLNEPARRPGAAPGAPRLAALPGGGEGRSAKAIEPVAEADWPLERVTAAARQAQGKADAARNASMITAPSIPMQRERKLSVVPSHSAEGRDGTAVAGEQARTRAEPIKAVGTRSTGQRGKPRYLGLILTLALLLILAAIATWSSLFLAWTGDSAEPAVASAPTDPVAAPDALAAASPPETDPATPPATETAPDAADPALTDPATDLTADATDPALTDPAAEPAPVDEMLADGQDPEALADEALADAAASPQAAPATDPAATDLAALDPAADPAPEPAPPAVESATVAVPDTSAAAARTPSDEPQDEIFLAMIDPAIVTTDATALAPPSTATDARPAAQPAPPPFGTLYQFDAEGRIIPTKEGVITPEGVRLVEGAPPRVPPPRPAAAAAAPVAEPLVTPAAAAPEPAYADPALAGARPRARPEGLVPAATATSAGDDAALAVTDAPRFSSLRPHARPPEVLARGDAARAAEDAARNNAADAAVQSAAASLVASADAGSASALAIAVSRRPAPRPQDFNRAIETAVSVAAADATLTIASPLALPDTPIEVPVLKAPAAKAPAEDEPTNFASAPASDDPAIVEKDEPERTSAAPKIPTRALVAKQATDRNAINLAKTNLIGVYGTSSNRYAMVRQPNGRFVKVAVGDRIDGGRVAAISERELHYVRDGETHTLSMPKG